MYSTISSKMIVQILFENICILSCGTTSFLPCLMFVEYTYPHFGMINVLVS